LPAESPSDRQKDKGIGPPVSTEKCVFRLPGPLRGNGVSTTQTQGEHPKKTRQAPRENGMRTSTESPTRKNKKTSQTKASKHEKASALERDEENIL